jgi:hypothetical protein
MPYNDDCFYLGYCKSCQKFDALKNGLCAKCQDKDFPDVFKDIFGGFDEQKEK